jgi:hypothetical protein
VIEQRLLNITPRKDRGEKCQTIDGRDLYKGQIGTVPISRERQKWPVPQQQETMYEAAVLDIGVQVPQVSTVDDWRPVPTQDELDKLVASPANDLSFPYTD